MNGFKRTLLCLSLMLSGCSLLPQTTPEVEPVEPQETETGSFAPQTLFDLLVAEIAGQREQYALAQSNYLKQAQQTRDPAIIQRSLEIAQFIGAREAAYLSASLWIEVEPDNAKAQEALAIEQARTGQLEAATLSMQKAYELGGNARFGVIAGQAENLSLEERQRLLNLYDQLLELHPNHPNLLLGKALLLQQNQRIEEALPLLEQAAKLSPGNNRIPQLQARLLHDIDRDAEAADLLDDALDDFPDNLQLRLLYARVLVALDRLPEAQEQFEQLLLSSPNDSELLLSIGLVALENNQPELAQSRLEQLVQNDPNNSTGYYYLGQLAEIRGDTGAAIDYYQQVELGQELLSAKAQLTQLLLNADQLEQARDLLAEDRKRYPNLANTLYLLEAEALFEAHEFDTAEQVINEALSQYPNDTNLLYIRAMLAEKQGRIDLLEKDLRQVLAQEPDNTAALNALGYTLADRTDRFDEARTLIEHAYRLTPNDPAVIDSLAWVLYRQGEHQRALELLAHAFKLMPDHEIAAHYGELLWVTGQPAEATQVWQTGLEDNPNSEVLQQTLKRFLGQTEQ